MFHSTRVIILKCIYYRLCTSQAASPLIPRTSLERLTMHLAESCSPTRSSSVQRLTAHFDAPHRYRRARAVEILSNKMSSDDSDILRAARALSMPERLAHAHWKARVDAYEDVSATCAHSSSISDDRSLGEFGTYISSGVCASLMTLNARKWVMNGRLQPTDSWDVFVHAGNAAHKACSDGNAAALDAGLDATRAFLTIADEEYAGRHAGDILASVAAKGLSGRPKAVERSTECCMLLIELEQAEAVLDMLLKVTMHKVPKVALAAANAVLMAVQTFGTPKVVPPNMILKGLAPLFDAKDAKVRAVAKDITLEMVKWLGPGAVKRDLIDNMRGTMQAEVNKAMESVETNARPTRFLRRDQAKVDVEDASTTSTSNSMLSSATNIERAPASSAVPDAYEYASPENILPLLDRPGEGENPKFWDGIVSKKWQERLYALQTLTKLADAPKLASTDYGDVSKALKQVITKDSNVACIAEAARAAAALAKGARKDWARDARVLLPGMLDKLKDKTSAVIAAIQSALSEAAKYCFDIEDVHEDIALALGHKVPKVQIETLKWLTASFSEMRRPQMKGLYKTVMPSVVKCTSASNGDARNGALEALAACARTSGGVKMIEFLLVDLDASKKSKVEELAAAAAASTSQTAVAPMTAEPVMQRSNTVAAPSSTFSAIRDVKGSKSFSSARATAPLVETSSVALSAPKTDSSVPSDEVELRMVELVGADVLTGLKDANWKARLEAMTTVLEKAQNVDATSGDVCGTLVSGLAAFPGWSDSNFQVVAKMFATLGALSSQTNFSYRHAEPSLGILCEKLADLKLRGVASETLSTLAEAIGPKITIACVKEKAGGHKNPKVVSEGLTWTGTTVSDFGIDALDTDVMIDWAKTALETPNPLVKAAGAKLIGALHAGMGPSIKDYLTGLKDAQMRSLEVEIARNPYEGIIVAKRSVRKSNSKSSSMVITTVAATSSSVVESAAEVSATRDAPRTDISAGLTEDFLKSMNDSNWKTRAAALEEVDRMLASANKRIEPNVGDLMRSLSARFADSNRMLAVQALNIAGDIALAVGPPIERVGRSTLSDIIRYFGDSKKNVREAAAKACTSWVSAVGLAKLLPTVAEKFQEYSAKINGEGKKEALEWCLGLFNQEIDVNDAMCSGAAHFASVGLGDKTTEARKPGGALVDAVVDKYGADKVLALTSSLSNDLKSALEAHLSRGRPTLGFKAAGAAVMAANAIKSTVAGTAASRNAARKIATMGGSARGGTQEVTSNTGPVFLIDGDKDARLRKYPRKALKFETLRDEDLLLVTKDIRSSSMAYFRKDVHKLMFADDIKSHLAALDALDDAIKANEEELVNSFDLLLRWLMLRISEASPNTQVLTRVLDVVTSALHAASDMGYKLTEQEASLLVPVLVEKSGHSIDAIREKFQAVARCIPLVYLPSKFVGHLTTGLTQTKSSRTRAECLDEIARLIERYGLLVCLREDKTLNEVVKLVDTRDMSQRNCTLNCLASAYKVAGEDVWKRIGKLPNDQVKEIVSDKFARVAKEMYLSGEGEPGNWSKFNPIPIASALDGVSVSASLDSSVLVTSSLTNMMASATISRGLMSDGKRLVSQSLTALPSRATPQVPVSSPPRPEPMDVDVSVAPVEVINDDAQRTIVDEDVFYGAAAPTVAPTPSAALSSKLKPTSNAWSRAIVAVSDVDDRVAVEAMKSVCHEIMSTQGQESARASMVGDINSLVISLVKRVGPIFTSAIANPSTGSRGCKYVLNALMQIHQERAFATAIAESTQRAFITELIVVLLNEGVLTLDEGDALIKAANLLMITMLENCTRSYTFVAFLTLLHQRPYTVPAQFDDLVVKCLIKLTRNLQITLDNVHLPTVLAAIHTFFAALGVDEINKRALVDNQALRVVRTLLHELTTRVGPSIYKYCENIPPRTASPPPMIYAFMDVNLKAPQSMASPEMKQRPMQTSSTLSASAQFSTMATTSQGMSAKSKLSAIFKKIGDKATTSAGLEELYDFTLDHPEEDLQPQLERTSDAFQMYIKRGLQKVEKSRSKRHEPDAEQPPSPAAAAKTSAAVYRERLARIQQNVGDVAPVSVDIATITNDASDLERIRARMNRITAQATGSAPAPCK